MHFKTHSKSTAFLTVLTLLLSLLSPLSAQAGIMASQIYTDVKDGDWFSSSASWGLNEGLLDVKKTQFNPHNQIIRADAAVILHRYLNEPAYQGLSVFTDVPEGAYYTLPVNAMAKQGVITGYLNANGLPNGKFGSFDSLNRAQAALLIVRMSEGKFDSQATLLPFKDIDSTHYGYQALSKLYGAKVIVGYPDGTVRPNTAVTRAEFMEMLYKSFKPDVVVTPTNPSQQPTDPVQTPQPTQPTTQPTDPVLGEVKLGAGAQFECNKNVDFSQELNAQPICIPGPNGLILPGLMYKSKGYVAGGYPSLVVLHGSGGLYAGSGSIGSDLDFYPDLIRKNGGVAILVDSYTPRGYPDGGASKPEETVRTQDAYKTLDFLLSLNSDTFTFVNGKKVALMGFSHGGSGSNLAAAKKEISPVAGDMKNTFAVAITYYGGCGIKFDLLNDAKYLNAIPLYLILSDIALDDVVKHCPAMESEALAGGASESSGNPISSVTYTGAEHSFFWDYENKLSNQTAREKSIEVAKGALEKWSGFSFP